MAQWPLSLLILAVTAGIFVADSLTPIGMAVCILYACPVYLSGWWPRHWQTFLLAALCMVLTIAGYFTSPPGGIPFVDHVNRALVIVLLGVAAGLTLVSKQARLVIEEHERVLERRVVERTEQLRTTTAEKERIGSELKIASDIQRSILPRTFPPFPDRKEFDIYAETIPAREMGGDFYDFFLVDPARLGFVIADVSDKGVPAAIFMAITRSLIKATATKEQDPGACLSHVNRLLYPDNESAMFVTVFYGVLDLRTGEVRYCNAGHNPPYVVRETGLVEAVPKTGGTALAVMDGLAFETGTLRLQPDESLFLYTDGITEAMDREGRLFSDARLSALLARTAGRLGPQEVIRAAVTAVQEFASGAAQSDDITALALRYRGPA